MWSLTPVTFYITAGHGETIAEIYSKLQAVDVSGLHVNADIRLNATRRKRYGSARGRMICRLQPLGQSWLLPTAWPPFVFTLITCRTLTALRVGADAPVQKRLLLSFNTQTDLAGAGSAYACCLLHMTSMQSCCHVLINKDFHSDGFISMSPGVMPPSQYYANETQSDVATSKEAEGRSYASCSSSVGNNRCEFRFLIDICTE